MNLFIKNMKGESCCIWLQQLLDEIGFTKYKFNGLGELWIDPNDHALLLPQLQNRLKENNMAVTFNRKEILTEKVKHLIYNMMCKASIPAENYSSYISNSLNLSYAYLANIFSTTEHCTIEHFIISVKISKAKELIISNAYSLSEISYFLHYSSIAHFSAQFKKVTGKTASNFKKEMEKSLS